MKIKTILAAAAAATLLMSNTFAQPRHVYDYDFENFEENSDVAAEIAGVRTFKAVKDPDNENNMIGMITYYGNEKNVVQQLKKEYDPITGGFICGWRVKFSDNCTDKQAIQIKINTQQSGSTAVRQISPWKLRLSGLEGCGTNPNMPGTAPIGGTRFKANTWYDVRFVVNLETKKYDFFRREQGEQSYERVSPEGGYYMRDSGTYDYDTYGVKNFYFEATGTMDSDCEKIIYCDDIFCGQYEFEAPEAESVYPADGTENVNTELKNIKITFSDDMDESTLDGNITLRNENGDTVDFSGTLIGREYTMELSQQLDYDTEYTVEISENVKNFLGESARNITSIFRTQKPTVKIGDPTFATTEENTVSCEFTAENMTENDKDILLIFAAYDSEGYVTSGTYRRMTLKSGTQPFGMKMETSAADAEKVILYAWDNFENCSPIKDCFEFECNK